MAPQYTIRDLTKEFDVSARALRFYESKGLLSPARKGSSRRYDERDRIRLMLTLRGKRIGLSLKEIKELLSINREPDATASDVKKLAEQKLADLEDKIRSLQRMKKALRSVAEHCPGRGPISDCSILRSLTDDRRGKGAKK